MPFDPVPLNSGRSIPGIAFGTGSDWRKNPRAIDEDGVAREVVEAVKAAIAAGFRSIDCAEAYQNEKSVGVGIKESGVPREELFVTDKVNASLHDIPALVKSQLALLQLDYFDLYLIHTPTAVKDGLTFLGVWRELEELVEEGLIRSIGVSNYRPEHFEQFLSEAKIKPAVNQISIYPYILDKVELNVKYCESKGIKIEAYEVSSTLIRDTEKGGPVDVVVAKIIEELRPTAGNITEGQVLLQWISAKGWVSVTTSSKPTRMAEYVGAGDFRLSSEQVARIDAAGREGGKGTFGKYTSW